VALATFIARTLHRKQFSEAFAKTRFHTARVKTRTPLRRRKVRFRQMQTERPTPTTFTPFERCAGVKQANGHGFRVRLSLMWASRGNAAPVSCGGRRPLIAWRAVATPALEAARMRPAAPAGHPYPPGGRAKWSDDLSIVARGMRRFSRVDQPWRWISRTKQKRANVRSP
jgi:hypothetical protein